MKAKASAGTLIHIRKRLACQATEAADRIFTAVGSELSLSLKSRLTSGSWEEIVSAGDSLEIQAYTNAGSFSRDYLCAEMMSKFPCWDLGIDKAHVALQKFSSSEDALESFSCQPPNFSIRAGARHCTMAAVIHTARQNILRVLGDFCLEELLDSCCFGPGASTSLTRRESDLAFKFGASLLHATKTTIAYLPLIARAYPGWTREVSVVEGSRLVTVPKNAKTDRAICIEPDLNMFLQKGVGNMIRRRLNRIGLLKPDSQLDNQRAAGQGSANGSVSTIDLSGASDSIHLGVVWELLPSDWFTHIENMRSPNVRLPDGGVINLLKVSSMGNGYTFELETLIFWALARAVTDLLGFGHVKPLVFGDDIIVATDVARPLIDVLASLCFKTNEKKTHIDGPFRESCGKHFFLGNDVTPFYIRGAVDTVPRIYWLHNSLKRWARYHYGIDANYLQICTWLKDLVHPAVRFTVPDGVGDCGFIGNWDESAACSFGDGHEGWRFKGAVDRSRKITIDSRGVLLKSLFLGRHAVESPMRPDRETSAADIPRGTKLSISRNLRVVEWPDLGPWL